MAGVTVVTGWHPAAWEHYARRFAETFDRHWPATVDLIAYPEELVRLPRGFCRLLWEIDGAREFIARHKSVPEHCGLKPTPHWRSKDHRKLANGISGWRWDAMRFFKQCIIPHHAARFLDDGDILVWLDADIVTFADVPEGFVGGLLADADLCYLGRNKGAEIGFWAVTLNSQSRAFLADLSSYYLDDRIFALAQYHSAYAFDHALVSAERKKLHSRDLTPGGRDHVFVRSPIGRYCDHLKGSRKDIGYSPEHPMKWWL